MIALYVAFAALYSVAPPLKPGWMYAISMLSAAVLLGIVFAIMRSAPWQWVQPLTLIGALVSGANALLFVAISNEPAQTVVLIIILLGASYLFLSLRYTCITVAISVLAWLAVTWGFDFDARLHWLINLGTASAVSVLITWSHSRLVGRLEERTAAEVTARDQIELQAEHLAEARDGALASVRAKSEFLANMSHELRTPMNGIIGISHLLLADDLTSDQRDYVTTLISSSESLLTIVDDILDFARIDAGKLDLQTRPLEIGSQVQSVVKLLRPRADAAGIDLSAQVGDRVPPWVMGDPARLRQVLINLVGNALKFTEKGSVRVEVSLDDDADDSTKTSTRKLRIAVTDTGVGIPADRMTAIFEPFSQLDSSSTRSQQGTGLGLTISRRLVALMGGTLTAESTVGEGSTFWFTAVVEPCDPVASTTAAEVPARERRRSNGQPTILVVEDNAVNQLVIVKLVEALGYEVDVVEDGAAAIRAVAESNYALILMDCQMPEMDGYEVTAEIRRKETADEHVPIIAVTAHAMRGDRERCLEAGMDDYLAKPLRPADLEAAIDRWANPARNRVGSFLDPDTLDDFLRHQGPEFVTHLIGRYLSDAQERLTQIRAASAVDNLTEVISQAHSLKGSSALVGARTMMDLCAEVQAACDADDPAKITASIAGLSAELSSMAAAAEIAEEPAAQQLNS